MVHTSSKPRLGSRMEVERRYRLSSSIPIVEISRRAKRNISNMARISRRCSVAGYSEGYKEMEQRWSKVWAMYSLCLVCMYAVMQGVVVFSPIENFYTRYNKLLLAFIIARPYDLHSNHTNFSPSSHFLALWQTLSTKSQTVNPTHSKGKFNGDVWWIHLHSLSSPSIPSLKFSPEPKPPSGTLWSELAWWADKSCNAGNLFTNA